MTTGLTGASHCHAPPKSPVLLQFVHTGGLISSLLVIFSMGLQGLPNFYDAQLSALLVDGDHPRRKSRPAQAAQCALLLLSPTAILARLRDLVPARPGPLQPWPRPLGTWTWRSPSVQRRSSRAHEPSPARRGPLQPSSHGGLPSRHMDMGLMCGLLTVPAQAATSRTTASRGSATSTRGWWWSWWAAAPQAQAHARTVGGCAGYAPPAQQ